MKKLESLEQFEQLKQEEKVIFLFTADWCADCRVIEPFLPTLETEFAEYEFVTIDRDEFIDLCSQLDIFGIPSFVAFSEGTETGRFVSKNRKTKEEIEEFINSLT
ncbi:thiol reductase thioredoxin [Sporosarcina sp. P18a]|uniref:thioredoxin family protein n=1 Tax=unclassified Sporosarcina TaxID=2647733 RepID=UPI000C1661CB|nr:MULTISPECIES: thioredoxin family protein [unclassified Sporosarcina]PIC71487.1 thiol reductase thioredoxin [Sporosarcina sp. P16b]PIC80298.1 thiol reductase thioredoxin [Sporosarcina sp. P18a]PID02275.1 thiol reductase thioredoxin [Sporosarcina sp. P2]